MSAMVQVVVNGEQLDVASGLNVTKLLLQLGIVTGRVAIERNLNILPRAEWDQTTVSAGDRYEIVHLVGGG
jgi:thiamine biosynthesis protein ThiS